MIEQDDWEFHLLFGSALPQGLDDLFLQSDNTSINQFRDEIPTETVANLADAASGDVSSWIGEMENFLMQDDDGGACDGHDHQISDLEHILLPPAIPSEDKDSSDSKDSDSNSVPETEGDETNADCLSKGQLRKLKNRDAALRSRERRRTYVKDLEMKSKYMEAECRRLDRLLQCCYAENNMLRVSLHNANAFSGYMAKAESAVLVLESLLLGSLLWLLVTVCLLPRPKEATSPQNANKDLELPLPRRSRGSKLTILWVPLSFLSKRCRSSRTRMKVGLLETHPLVCS